MLPFKKIQRSITGVLRRRTVFLLAMAALAMCWAPTVAQAWHDHYGAGQCRSLYVPMTIPNVGPANVYAELCLPYGPTPETVQLLVHGSTYNHHYWDTPLNPERYSHVVAALEAGYATLNIDRIGTGLSTKPPSHLVTVDLIDEMLHQLVTKLRGGEIGGYPFSRVVYFGSSLTVVNGWVLGSRHPEDIDAFVLTGTVHYVRPGFVDLVMQYHVDPACESLRFKYFVPDCGYVTTRPGWRDDFFWYVPGGSPLAILVDELLKDVVSISLMFETAALALFPDPETSPSRDIAVPTLIVLGEHDATACGPDGLVCTEETIRDLEAPFFRSDIVLDVLVPENTGHALTLHRSAPETADFIHDWLDEHVGAN
jgi:pimeloyl-ACP methyl ester carboxylesterase